MKIAIVLVGFNRPLSIERLCLSVAEADCNIEADLIVSIDKSISQDKVVAQAINLNWVYGKLIIRALPKRLGLRDHILLCGDLTENYDVVVVLEDDIIVSNSFLNYLAAAIKFVGQDDSVAGISLYAPSINEMAMLPFTPKKTGFDNYYLQSAQSWGQCWTRSMWQGFRVWYDKNSSPLIAEGDMPDRIYSWPETSWKKYFMKYLVETGKTFFYPYDSFSSNFSDVGQHNKFITPHFQVPLISDKSDFRFGRQSETPCYDIFFERIGFTHENNPLCLDFYGTRTLTNSRFLLTPKKIKASKIKSFGLTYRPQEDNYLKSAPGDDVHLYDLGENPMLRTKQDCTSFKMAKYHTNLEWRNALIYGATTLKHRLFNKVKFK
jgi:hypothetical protein